MSCSRMPGCQGAGFTLIELLIVIAMIAILITVGLPSFSDSLRSNRLATTTNELIASIALARSEAIRSTRGAGLCATSDGTACAGADRWAEGWLVWEDTNGNSNLDASEPVVRHVQGKGQLALNEVGNAAKLVFNSRGALTGPAQFRLQPIDCPLTKPYANTLTLNGSGQVKTSKTTCK